MWIGFKIAILLFILLVLGIGIFLFVNLIKEFHSFDKDCDGKSMFKSN
jgi:hypothetical protein